LRNATTELLALKARHHIKPGATPQEWMIKTPSAESAIQIVISLGEGVESCFQR